MSGNEAGGYTSLSPRPQPCSVSGHKFSYSYTALSWVWLPIQLHKIHDIIVMNTVAIREFL